MGGFVANTDFDWYQFLAAQVELAEVNFWQPSGGRDFHALSVGDPLLFKLKKPHYAVAGFGFYARHARVPAWLAWESFGIANGAPDFETMRRRIEKYRGVPANDESASYEIGCILLSSPVFFPEPLWIAQPSDWKRQVVQGATYNLTTGEGYRVWQDCLAAASLVAPSVPTEMVDEPARRYGDPVLIFPRLGQGIFRIGVMDAYRRSCAVSGEHSLPVLEAAHIRPYSAGGPHEVRNGLLLRSDIHKLFDKGYMTVTPKYTIEVSPG
jgi:putative restriction endonuclease